MEVWDETHAIYVYIHKTIEGSKRKSEREGGREKTCRKCKSALPCMQIVLTSKGCQCHLSGIIYYDWFEIPGLLTRANLEPPNVMGCIRIW